MIEKFWEVQPIPFRVNPLFDLVCVFCGKEMKPAITQTIRFKLDLHRDEGNSHAFDNWTRCVGCGWTTIHGVAIGEDEYREIITYYTEKVKKNECEIIGE